MGDADTLDPAALSAGIFTTAENGANAYAVPIAMLDKERAEIFIKGKEQFNEAWVFAPEPGGVWGLGPTFNEDRCARIATRTTAVPRRRSRDRRPRSDCWCD
jgi:CxxC motif-containing protein (DUF1111 family)